MNYKRNTTLYIDIDLIRRAKLRGINLSKTLEDALISIMDIEVTEKEFELQKGIEKIKDDIIDAKRILTEKSMLLKEMISTKEDEEKKAAKKILVRKTFD